MTRPGDLLWYATLSTGGPETVRGVRARTSGEAADIAVRMARCQAEITGESWRLLQVTPSFPEHLTYTEELVRIEEVYVKGVRRRPG